MVAMASIEVTLRFFLRFLTGCGDNSASICSFPKAQRRKQRGVHARMLWGAEKQKSTVAAIFSLLQPA